MKQAAKPRFVVNATYGRVSNIIYPDGLDRVEKNATYAKSIFSPMVLYENEPVGSVSFISLELIDAWDRRNQFKSENLSDPKTAAAMRLWEQIAFIMDCRLTTIALEENGDEVSEDCAGCAEMDTNFCLGETMDTTDGNTTYTHWFLKTDVTDCFYDDVDSETSECKQGELIDCVITVVKDAEFERLKLIEGVSVAGFAVLLVPSEIEVNPATTNLAGDPAPYEWKL
jgi:hypothetical protein